MENNDSNTLNSGNVVITPEEYKEFKKQQDELNELKNNFNSKLFEETKSTIKSLREQYEIQARLSLSFYKREKFRLKCEFIERCDKMDDEYKYARLFGKPIKKILKFNGYTVRITKGKLKESSFDVVFNNELIVNFRNINGKIIPTRFFSELGDDCYDIIKNWDVTIENI